MKIREPSCRISHYGHTSIPPNGHLLYDGINNVIGGMLIMQF